MKEIVIKYNDKLSEYVLVNKISSYKNGILCAFLLEVGYQVDSYIELLQDPEFKYGMGNSVTLDKPGDGTIALTLFVFEDMDPEPEFKTTVDNLIKIIKDWDCIHKKKFPKVLMTVDGDQVSFEPIEEIPKDHESIEY